MVCAAPYAGCHRHLSSNRFHGPLPTELGNLNSAQELDGSIYPKGTPSTGKYGSIYPKVDRSQKLYPPYIECDAFLAAHTLRLLANFCHQRAGVALGNMHHA
eukprot:9474272-Pyramimonas_sp.AAC.1